MKTVLLLCFFVATHTKTMDYDESELMATFDYYTVEKDFDFQEPVENYCPLNYIAHYDDYFSQQYNQTIAHVISSNCLSAPLDNVYKPFATAQASQAVVCQPIDATKSMQLPQDSDLYRNVVTNKPINYRYSPSPALIKNPERLERYNAFYELINKRYDDAIKQCCNEQFENLADLRIHVKNNHAKKDKTLRGQAITYVFTTRKAPVTYSCIDTAISYVLHKKNKDIFNCNRCDNKFQAHASFYFHYMKKCTK